MKIAKRILSLLVAAAVVLSCWVWIAPQNNFAKAANLTGDSNYLFAYFTGTSIEGQTIHLAVSRDGLNYTALHNNDPVIIPSKGTGCVRDPYLWYNENDGYYYILATDLDFTDTGSDYSDNSESFIVWRSKDLVNWYDETMIDVKAILGRLGINNNNMQAVWAPQVLWDGSDFVVYFSLQCDGTSNGSWNPLTIVYLKTSDLLDESKYYKYGVIHNPGRHVIDADIIKKPNTNQYYMFYKDEAASGGIQSIYYMISDNGPTGPYYAPNNANGGRGPQLFSEIGKNLEGCNSFFDDNGNLITYVDEYDYTNSAGQKEAHFHVSRSSDFSTFTTLPDSSHNINTLSPRHGSVVKITDEEYNRLLEYSGEITSSSFPETENLSDHLVGRYFTTADYTYNAANGKKDLTLTDGSISTATDTSGDYYAYFNGAGAEINLANLISGDLNIKDGFTITFTASAPSTLGSNARFFDISNNWSQRTNPAECYLHMSPVAVSNGLYVGAYNGPVTTSSWTWASQGNNYNDGAMHDYIISFADGNMILYIDGQLAMKRDRYNMNAEYGDNFLADNWYKEIGNSKMRIGKSEWADPLFTGAMQNLCIYDRSLSYYDVQKMQKLFDAEAGKTTIAKIAVPETVYMTPSTGESKTGQYYVNNTMHNGTNEINLEKEPGQTSGTIEFYIPGAKHFIVELNTVTSGIGDVVLGEAGDTSKNYENITYNADANGYFSYTTLGIHIDGTGISAGKSALAEWKITVIMQDDSETTHYAYTTLYSPWYTPVGAATRARTNSKAYAQSIAWVSGVHGYTKNTDDSKYWIAVTNETLSNESKDVTDRGTYYVKTSSKAMVPLIYGVDAGDNDEQAVNSWLSKSAPGGGITDPTIRYFSLDNNGSHGGVMVADISPVANITVDTSRYTNLNQIPNLTVGYNVTDTDGADSVYWYASDYTDVANSYTKANNGTESGKPCFFNWTKSTGKNSIDDYEDEWFNGTSTGKIYKGSATSSTSDYGTGVEYNSSYDRAIVAGSATYDYMFKGAQHTYNGNRAYSINYVQLRATNVDKTQLRNLVLKSTFFNQSDYTSASWNIFKAALQNAALALGDPANSSVDSVKTALQNAINALQTTVTINANGGTINGAATTSYNVTIGAESSVTSDLSAYVPVRAGYKFKGWAASANAESGSMTVTTGFMPTLYAVWEEIKYYTVAYDANGGSGSIASVTVEVGKSFALAPSGFTKDGYTLIGWSTSASATTAEYQLGQSVNNLTSTNNATVTLYAVWKEISYTVVYNANGGSGSIASVTVRVSETFTLASAGFTKAGYNLNGWATTASATAPEYQLGQSVSKLTTTNGATVTLYAVWGSNVVLASDTVVLDFATPVVISPTDNDNSLKGLTYSVIGISADGENYASTLNGDYGSFSVSGEKVTYTPSTTVDGTEVIYYHVSVNGSTLKETITVAPASNVLYEENNFVTNEVVSGITWTKDGTTLAVNQDSSTANDVYGYDSKVGGYNQIKNYSNGSALIATVTEKTKTSNNATFTFNGTGFDLNSVCGSNTGVLIVSLRNNDTNKMVKSYIIDTYYGDANYGTLYQVPVITDTGRDHANYTVQVVASWLPSMSGAIKADKAKQEEEQQKLQPASVNGIEATVVSGADNEALRNALAELGMDYIFDAEEVEVVWFDDNSVLNGGMGVNTPVAGDTLGTASLTGLLNVIDSVRVYNPIENGNDYYIESEKNAAYYNVIENLSKANGGVSLLDKLFAYITGKLGVDENGNDIELTISNYESVGPKDELYLAESTSVVAFKISNFAAIKGADGRVMISLRAASGTPKLKIGENDFAVNSNTEMYYDITDYISDDGTVTLQNTSTDKSLLAIGYLKTTCPASAVAASISSDVDLETVKMMMMAPSVTVEPNTTPTPEEPAAPEIPATPEDPAEPEDPASECWLVRIFKWIFNSCVKIFNVLKGFLAI